MKPGPADTRASDELIANLKAGRDQTIAALRARIHAGLGAALAGRSDVSEADLDDFAQDAVLRVLERLDTFRGESSFTTWAMAVAVRVSLTALRRRRWTAESVDRLLEDRPAPASSAGDGSASGDRGELFSALRTAIAQDLTPRQRRVLLAELAGVPQVVLAERLSSTPGAIYKVSHDARRRLKDTLARAGFDSNTVKELLADEP